ncbi:TPA: hypothetical protein L4951_003551 [Pseudomonas aeruginosa]|nr:hypothetical protein [Pseudomonas aeruginosa]
MNPTQSLRRPTFTVVVQSLLWLWLIGLSVFALRGHQAINDQADQQRLDTRLQRLEAQVAGLAATMQQQPAAATAAGLQDTRQALEARIAQIEQTMGGHATADDVLALRKEVEQIRARQTTPRATTPAQRRSPSQPVTAKPEPPPLPFRIVGAELRAGQRSLSVAPSSGDFTPDRLQVLLPGDVVGSWRLQAVEGNSAVFQTGDQTRRVAIP